nr:GHKL domain-containing protein [uncultured Aminipila sp.]
MENFNLSNTWFEFIFYFCILNGCLALLEMAFFSRFVNQTIRWYHYFMYVVMIYLICAVEIQMRVPFTVATVLELAALWGFGCLILKCSPVLSAITTILTITIMQVVNGIFKSLASIICSFGFINAKSITFILLISSLLAIATTFFSYKYVIKSYCIKKTYMNQYVMILLIPIVFVLLVVQHIFMTYGSNIVLNSTGGRLLLKVNDLEMLIIQIVAYFCLIAVLFAYRKLSEGFKLQMQNALLEQQMGMQKDYMQEVQTRYEQTRAFRHDIKNHWTVINELLKTQENQKALAYLKKIEITSDKLSFPCQTGNTVIDMLLSNKLGLALQMDIQIECTVKIPPDCKIDEMDLCIVFSNAVDNAIKACSSIQGGEKYIMLSAAQKGTFFMVEAQNSQSKNNNFQKGSGLGLNNIKAVAEKYNGTMSVESNFEYFKLNVLFIIPLHSNNHPLQSH